MLLDVSSTKTFLPPTTSLCASVKPAAEVDAPTEAFDLRSAAALYQSMQIARALKMGGVEALLFVAQANGTARPVVSALLDQLEIQGMNT